MHLLLNSLSARCYNMPQYLLSTVADERGLPRLDFGSENAGKCDT